jgi:hypothetical protein
MKDRCLNPKNMKYKYWGALGVKVHPPWIDDFEAFLLHVGPRPSSKHSLDRYPDRNGNYVPGNVRWATQQQQKGNRRNSYCIPLPDVASCGLRSCRASLDCQTRS